MFGEFTGFEWDQGNRQKNWLKHRVAWWECEESFFNQPLFVLPDESHSASEPRFYALGTTHLSRLLFVVFTQRTDRIRIVSARDMSKKERSAYLAKAEEDAET